MKKVLILVVFALIGSGLYASNEKVVSEKEGKRIVTDTIKKGGQKIDLQKMLQSGVMPKFNLTQNITPVNVSSTNKNVKVLMYTLNDAACVVQLDVTGCKGKLVGIDTSAYLTAGSDKKYKIKSVKEVNLPVDTKTAMKWDAKKNVLYLEFPSVKIISGQWDWELVLSEGKDGVRVKTRFETRK